MKKLLLASVVLGTGVALAACSSKSTTTTSLPTTNNTAQVSPSEAPSIAVGEPTPATTMTEDKVAPATKTDSVDDLKKEVSSYTIEQESFN
jgi:curli biogenesis system outer membrane secretion channel CsgG